MPTPFQPEAAEAKAFSAAYEKRFAKVPNYYSAFTYDAMIIATKAMEALAAKGQPITRQALRDQIATLPARRRQREAEATKAAGTSALTSTTSW